MKVKWKQLVNDETDIFLLIFYILNSFLYTCQAFI